MNIIVIISMLFFNIFIEWLRTWFYASAEDWYRNGYHKTKKDSHQWVSRPAMCYLHASTLLSPLKCLTSVFGMDTGVSTLPLSPFLFEGLILQNWITAFHLSAWLSPRPISTSQLHASLHFHPRPIYLVVFKGSYFLRMGNLILEGASRLDAFSAYPFPT